MCFLSSHFKCNFCNCCSSFVSLVCIIYQILFGFKVFTLNVNMSHCLIIYCCLFTMRWNESFTLISIMDLTN